MNNMNSYTYQLRGVDVYNPGLPRKRPAQIRYVVSNLSNKIRDMKTKVDGMTKLSGAKHAMQQKVASELVRA